MYNMDKISDAEKKRVKELYGCDKNPLYYQIKPRGTFEIREARKVTKEDFED